MRRPALTLVLTAVALFAAGPLAAPQDPFTVLEPQPDGPRITPYLAYQTEMAWGQDDRRRARLAGIRTERELLAYQAELRTKLLRMLGGLPAARTPLNPQTTGRIKMDGFHIEKLIFESLPGIFVTALVYVPESARGPHPAVLVACGHSANGKAYYHALCQRLARRGYVVICWDPIGQGERSQFWDATRGRSRYNLICGEHAILGNLAYLAGANLARWEVWDGIRALDYLLTRDDVDPARISITGTSGGGFQATFIAALDQRIKAVAPSCYITALPMRVWNRIFKDPDSDPEQDPAGMIAEGIDHAGLLVLMYPRPVFLAAAVLDFFPIEGTRSTFREVAALYRRFGQSDRIGMIEGYHGHDFSVENQAAAITFLDRFNGLPLGRDLPSTSELDERSLQVTRTGQVLLDYSQSRLLLDDIRDYYRAHATRPGPPLSALYRGTAYPGIDEWQVAPFRGSAALRSTIQWTAEGSSTLDDITIDKYVLHHSGGLQMPLLHMHRRGGGSAGVLLWLGENGKASAKDWTTVRRHVADGYDVVSFDPRGLGETRMRYTAMSVDDPSLAINDFDRAYVNQLSSVLGDYVYNAILTGRPYLLQLIEDVEIAARFSRAQLKEARVAIAAEGDAFTVAHWAVKALPDIRLVTAPDNRVLDWAQLLEEKQESWPIQYVFPGGAYVH
jgi:Acetyl xylan esterase (AXE1)